MKTIDKTSSKDWNYGTVLKCWDVDENRFQLLKISPAHSNETLDRYEVDTLHDINDKENTLWSKDFYSSIRDLQADIHYCYKHVMPVKATVVIEDL